MSLAEEKAFLRSQISSLQTSTMFTKSETSALLLQSDLTEQLSLIEQDQNLKLGDLHQAKKMEGDELYIEMRDKLSVEEDLLFDNSER